MHLKKIVFVLLTFILNSLTAFSDTMIYNNQSKEAIFNKVNFDSEVFSKFKVRGGNSSAEIVLDSEGKNTFIVTISRSFPPGYGVQLFSWHEIRFEYEKTEKTLQLKDINHNLYPFGKKLDSENAPFNYAFCLEILKTIAKKADLSLKISQDFFFHEIENPELFLQEQGLKFEAEEMSCVYVPEKERVEGGGGGSKEEDPVSDRLVYEDDYIPRNLLIILDNSHDQENLVAPRTAFSAAISGKTSPILVSKTLAYYTLNGDVARKYLDFKDAEWVIKEVNENLVLFFTHDYLQELKIEKSEAQKISSTPELTELELRLGLKINHMKTITSETLQAEVQGNSNYFLEALFTQKSLFVTKSDYPNPFPENLHIPVWSFYMMGHGKTGESILSLSLDSFNSVLDFFSNTITTRLLVYTSCYSGGINENQIYFDRDIGKQRTYPFAILSQSLTDAVAMSNYSINHAEAFKESSKQGLLDYAKIAQHALFSPTKLGAPSAYNQKYWGNEALIRFPGLEWFSVLDNEEVLEEGEEAKSTGQKVVGAYRQIVQIGSVLAKSRSAKNPLNITNYYRGKRKTPKGELKKESEQLQPKGLLLYAKDIPFELIINHPIDAIISMIPGDSQHIMKGIQTNQDPMKILDAFMKIEKLNSNKTFYIEKIGKIKDVLIVHEYNRHRYFGGGEEHSYETFAIFTGEDDKLGYFANGKQQEITHEKARLHQSLLTKFKKEILTIDSYEYTYSEKSKLYPDLKIQSSVKINNLTVSDTSAEHYKLVISLSSSGLPRDGIVWIKKLYVNSNFFGSTTKGELGLDEKDERTLEIGDYIYQKSAPANIYFTYNGTSYKEKGIHFVKIEENYKSRFLEELSKEEPIEKNENSASKEDIKSLNDLLKRKK